MEITKVSVCKQQRAHLLASRSISLLPMQLPPPPASTTAETKDRRPKILEQIKPQPLSGSTVPAILLPARTAGFGAAEGGDGHRAGRPVGNGD